MEQAKLKTYKRLALLLLVLVGFVFTGVQTVNAEESPSKTLEEVNKGIAETKREKKEQEDFKKEVSSSLEGYTYGDFKELIDYLRNKEELTPVEKELLRQAELTIAYRGFTIGAMICLCVMGLVVLGIECGFIEVGSGIW